MNKNYRIFSFILIAFLSIAFCVECGNNSVIDILKNKEVTKGLYVNHYDFEKWQNEVLYAKMLGFNTVVMDAERITKKHVAFAKRYEMHIIALLTVFPKGIRNTKLIMKYIKRSKRLSFHLESIGITEIQLDYIRFSDRKTSMTVQSKENIIVSAIQSIKKSCSSNMKWQATCFGRIPFRKKDRIGQNFDRFDENVDTICPMAYPSYYSKPELRKGEYDIVKRTVQKSVKRAKNSKVVVWLQGWRQKNIYHKNFKKFLKNQMDAALENGADGYIFWNVYSRYNHLYATIENKMIIAGL